MFGKFDFSERSLDKNKLNFYTTVILLKKIIYVFNLFHENNMSFDGKLNDLDIKENVCILN